MFHFYNEADKANQQYNETQEIEADAKKVKKRLDEENDGKTRCPKCGCVLVNKNKIKKKRNLLLLRVYVECDFLYITYLE